MPILPAGGEAEAGAAGTVAADAACFSSICMTRACLKDRTYYASADEMMGRAL